MVLTESHRSSQVRTYRRAGSVVFLKTNEPFGGLSNMAGGFPLFVNGIRILTSEALYQSCRFPHRPEVQWLILGQPSPMTAKMKSKPYRHDSRPDWDRVRVKIMRWCLRVKLAQNWDAFSSLLLETRDRPIVEESRKDDFWGARPVDEQTLVGMNVLGRLLMELREAVKAEGRVLRVEPVAIPDFLLGGRPIEVITAPGGEPAAPIAKPMESRMPAEIRRPAATQASLFEAGVLREVPPPEYGEESAEQVDVAGLKPYPAMKDSGVPWLGEVPEHWEVRRIRNLAEMRVSNVDKHAREGELPVRLCNYVDVYKHDRIRRDMAFMRATASPEEIARFRLEPRDVLITKDSEVWTDIGVPALVEQSDDDLVCGYHLALLRPFGERIRGEYLFRALQSTAVAYQFHVEANGVTRYGLSHSAIKSIWLPSPPLAEQAVIARFLDYVDGQTRRYLRSKQKLIKLLEEQKQAIVHRAVTRGLDPGGRLKPSGVEWLGDVPEHWEVVRNGRLFVQRNETGFPALPIFEVSLRTGVRVRGFGVSERKQIMADREKYKRACEGDIAYNMMRMWQGAVGIAPLDGLVSPAYVVLKPLEGTDARYFSALFRTPVYLGEVNKLYSRGIVRDRNRLYWEDFKQMPSPRPPLHEQILIANAIVGRTAILADGILRAQREIVLLREYRTRLIADVVTGKLDVREAAARLPAAAEEPELLEEAEAEALDDSGEEAAEDLDSSLLDAEA